MSGLSPPACLPHKGHPSSTAAAQSQGLSVRAWRDMCVHKEDRGEKKTERERESCLLNADQSVLGSRTRWPSLASDSSGHCPGKHLSAHTRTHTEICTGKKKILPPSQCFSFHFLPEKLSLTQVSVYSLSFFSESSHLNRAEQKLPDGETMKEHI